MKLIATMLLGATLGLGAAPALAADPAVEAPIRQFVDSFNKGDMAAAAATMAPRVSIIDEVAPFQWRGPDAFTRWGASLAADSKAKGYSNESVALGTPSRELVTSTNAYVIVPATYAFTQKGVKMAEVAQLTFTLWKVDGAWKITGWTWTGPEASVVK